MNQLWNFLITLQPPKIKHMYKLIWKGEEIDSAETKQEAMYLQREYEMAYGGIVTIKKTE